MTTDRYHNLYNTLLNRGPLSPAEEKLFDMIVELTERVEELEIRCMTITTLIKNQTND